MCRLAAQAALVELVEEQGLPPICAALAVQEDADVQLGRVLAQAVQVQALSELRYRSRMSPKHSLPSPGSYPSLADQSHTHWHADPGL